MFTRGTGFDPQPFNIQFSKRVSSFLGPNEQKWLKDKGSNVQQMEALLGSPDLRG